jgi:NTE family protein
VTAPQVLRSDPELTVVLGGGGSAAVAWEIGVLAGLAERGLDVRGARRMIGTSAGSVVACRVARGTSWSDLLQWAGAPRTQAAVDVDFPALMARLTEIGSTAGSPAQGRQSIGALALAASTGSAEGRRGEIEELLGRADWPDCDLVVTAVDARSGEFVTFTRDDGVALIDAVGASCAVPGVWPPVRIGDRAYVDGAVRSSVNASLAAGDPRVLVLAPQAGPTGLVRELSRLGAGTTVEAIAADEESLRAFGTNPLDTATGPASLDAGLRQGRAAGDVVGRLLAPTRVGGVAR